MGKSKELRLEVNRRFSKSERPEEIYQAMYNVLATLPPPWGLKGIPIKKIPKYDGDFSFNVSYTKQEKISPIKSFDISFMNRNRRDEPTDEPINDDRIIIDFHPKKIKEQWRYLMEVVFPTYIKASNPYLATIFDGDIYISDIGALNLDTGEYQYNQDYIDIRKGIYRIWQANYWDRELCHRAFKLTPEEVVQRLSGKVADCRVYENGVLLIYSFEPLLGDEILKINDELMPILRNC